MSGRLRVLVLTNLFPSNVAPGYAPFNRLQFASLGRVAEVTVFGIVPWRFGRYYAGGSSREVVHEERIDGLSVLHPRYPSIPGLPSLNAGLLAASVLPELLKRRGRFDIILASYAYPDGVAGIALGKALQLPVVVKCHGSDLNRVPDDRPARIQLERVLPRARGVVVVSQRLGRAARELGVPADRVHVVYNGVDRERFKPEDKRAARRRVGLPEDGEVVVAVGHLAEHKGTRDLLRALPALEARRPGVIVAFVGDGPLAREVAHQAEHGGVGHGRALAIGRVRHDEVPDWMAAADVVCLPSWDEGMPNVVREAHAAGRPVVATDVGGIPEAIFDPRLGRLVPPRQPEALAEALARTFIEGPAAPETIAEVAVVPTWDQSAAALLEVLERCLQPGYQGKY
jgi:teichuronic acid biosynthesis glycosyltransferase TuaC